MSRIIAFFDFDGTVTKKDTLLEFIRFVKGDFWFLVGFALHTPILILYKLNIIPNQKAKESVLRFFFGGMKVEVFDQHCKDFVMQRLPQLMRRKAMHEIDELKKQGAEVVIVSASPENWLHEWCNENAVACIASRMLVLNGKITGKLDGLNCHGEEKVKRITNAYNLSTYKAIYAYGDTPGDKYMLRLAHYKFYQPFR